MTNVFLPSYSVGEDVYKEAASICADYGKKAVCIGGHRALEKASGLLKDALKDSPIEVLDTLWYGGEAAYENVEMLKGYESVQNADMIFAFGGGKALDTCKVLSDQLNKKLFTFPTIAGTCAAVTSVCAMYEPSGVFKDLYHRDRPAHHTFINTKVIAEAPDVYLWAGIGDTLAKGYEPEFSSRGLVLDHSNNVGVTLSVLCGEPLVRYGADALKDCQANQNSKALEETVLAIIVSTGLVSNYVINDYNSVVAHAMCYGFTTLKKVEEKHLHGEIVSYGLLVQLMLDNKLDELKKMLPFYRAVKLPTRLADLDCTLDDLEGVLKRASTVPDVNVSAIKVTEDNLRAAIENLENFTF